MPTNKDLCTLKPTPPTTYDTTDPTDVANFSAAHSKSTFSFAEDACEAGARTNGVDGMWIGKDGAGNEVWASLVVGPSLNYACDGPHRAFIQFQVLEDKSDVAGVHAIILTGLPTLDTVAEWHEGITGGNNSDRYTFIYDALVQEAKGNTDG